MRVFGRSRLEGKAWQLARLAAVYELMDMNVLYVTPQGTETSGDRINKQAIDIEHRIIEEPKLLTNGE